MSVQKHNYGNKKQNIRVFHSYTRRHLTDAKKRNRPIGVGTYELTSKNREKERDSQLRGWGQSWEGAAASCDSRTFRKIKTK